MLLKTTLNFLARSTKNVSNLTSLNDLTENKISVIVTVYKSLSHSFPYFLSFSPTFHPSIPNPFTWRKIRACFYYQNLCISIKLLKTNIIFHMPLHADEEILKALQLLDMKDAAGYFCLSHKLRHFSPWFPLTVLFFFFPLHDFCFFHHILGHYFCLFCFIFSSWIRWSTFK